MNEFTEFSDSIGHVITRNEALDSNRRDACMVRQILNIKRTRYAYAPCFIFIGFHELKNGDMGKNFLILTHL